MQTQNLTLSHDRTKFLQEFVLTLLKKCYICILTNGCRHYSVISGAIRQPRGKKVPLYKL